MNRIITPVEVSSFSERKDHSIRITIITNELTDEEFLILRKMQGYAGFMALQTEEIKDDLTDLMDDLDVEVYGKTKSLSQRLRSVLYVLYEQTAPEPTDEGFKLFYKQRIELIINQIKDKLN